MGVDYILKHASIGGDLLNVVVDRGKNYTSSVICNSI